tara:strand:+ start:137 stop:1159 length:1023 start_codon:yes stop_codon:yes gene_type:complete
MSARILQRATLYVLGLEDPAGGLVPPYYKIGITTDTVAKRIRQLQTGNPYRIVALHTFEIEGAEIVEQNLHRVYAQNRRVLEWFELSDAELAAVLQSAKDFKDDIEALVVEVRDLDQQYSNDTMLNPTAEATDLHLQAVTLEGHKTQNSLRIATIRSSLASITGTTRGIQGITQVSITNPSPGFSRRELKSANPDLYNDYLTIPEFKVSMKVLDKPTPGNYPNLVADKKQAAAAAPNVDPKDVTHDKESRTTDAVQLHSEYIDLVSQGGAIDRDLLLVKMKLKTLCGQARGIDGIFEYVREDRMTFDEDSFEADNPTLYSQFTVQMQPQRRFAVMKSRDY